MFLLLKELGHLSSLLPHAMLHDRDWLKVDKSITLPQQFTEDISDNKFWDYVRLPNSVFHRIYWCNDCLEAGKTTLSAAYGCVVTVPVHIRNQKVNTETNKSIPDACILQQWDFVYSLVLFLGFKCDTYFYNKLFQCED